MLFTELLDRFKASLTNVVVAMYPPQVLPKGPTTEGLLPLLRRPRGAQADAIRAAAFSLRREVATTIAGEMGTGKSLVAIAAVREAGFRRPLVVCPPQLPEKWVREVTTTVPGAMAVIVRSISDLERVRRLPDPFVATILSRERAKLGAAWRPASFALPNTKGEPFQGRHVFDLRSKRALRERAVARAGDGVAPGGLRIVRQAACPDCGALVVDEHHLPIPPEALARKRMRCTATVEGRGGKGTRQCGGALWTVTPHPRRTALADYIREHMRGAFDVVIADEWHEFKATGSAQGIAVAALIVATGKVLALTGTLLGGYASTLFRLLFRADPTIRAEYGWKDEARWIAHFGIVERIDTLEDDEGDDGRVSKRKITSSRTQERPGITPGIVVKLLRNTVFLHLPDVANDLPPYRERVVAVPMDRTPLVPRRDANGALVADKDGNPILVSQADIYHQLAQDLQAAVKAALAHNSKRLLGAYLQSLLGWADGCVREERVHDPKEVRQLQKLAAGLGTGDTPLEPLTIAYAQALPEDRVYPKEQALVDLCLDNQRRGRRVMVYVQHTGTRDLLPRLQSILARHGITAAILRSGTVTPEKREAWLAERVKQGIDACLVHPRLVQTGLDLLAFPSICFYQIDYSVYTMRQAARRSWRIGQDRPVEVTHLAYDGTLQTVQLALVSAKLRSSLMLEGQLPEEGLAALEEDEGDTFVQLARRLTREDGDEAVDVERVVAELQAVEVEGNEYLLADEAKAELARAFAAQVETPEIVATSWRDEAATAPTVVIQLDAAPSADGDGPDGEDAVPQPAAEPSVPAPTRKLSFLELRAELVRRGVKLSNVRGRKPAPEQQALFGA